MYQFKHFLLITTFIYIVYRKLNILDLNPLQCGSHSILQTAIIIDNLLIFDLLLEPQIYIYFNLFNTFIPIYLIY